MIRCLRSFVSRYLLSLPEGKRTAVTEALLRGLRLVLAVLGHLRVPMRVLASLSGSDKIGGHDYIGTYARFFSKYRNRRISLLEIGVGGYDQSTGGKSLLLWEAYFPRARVVAIDVFDKTKLSRGRIRVYQCSQIDEKGLHEIASRHGPFDIVIDDGSHLNEHQIRSFEILFLLMKEEGLYVVEDTQTSYWPAYGGGSIGSPGYSSSATNYFKGLVDGLNHVEYLPSARAAAGPFREQISGIYFQHNLVVLVKGKNTGVSSFGVEARAGKLESGAASDAGLLK